VQTGVVYHLDSADVRRGERGPDPDDLHNSVGNFLTKDTSTVKYFHVLIINFSRLSRQVILS